MKSREKRTLPGRADLARARPLRSPGPRRPSLLMLEHGGRDFVVKDVSHLRGARRRLFRWLLRREARAYRALEGLPGLPPFHGFLDPDALLLGFLRGDVLRRESIPMQRKDYFERLEEVVRSLHARGWLHLDLGHRSNVLVLPEGGPALVDFCSSGPWARIPLLGRLGRWIDLRAIRRLRHRYGSSKAFALGGRRGDSSGVGGERARGRTG